MSQLCPQENMQKSLEYSSFSLHPVLGAEIRFCSASPSTWETDSYNNFILHLFLSAVWVLSPSLCYSQRLLKCSLQVWKRAARAGVVRWTSMSERPDFFCHPDIFFYKPDVVTWICQNEEFWYLCLKQLNIWEKEGKGIFKLNVKISAGKHLKKM